VSLFPGSHGVSLYFTFEECEDLSKSLTLNRGFNVAEDVLQHLFTLTNGHPGLFHGLFKALIDREASACSSKYYCFRSLSSLFLLFVTPFSLYSTNAGQLFDADLCCPVQDIRASVLATGLVSLNNASEFFDNDEELISCMQSCIGRSVPDRSLLSKPCSNELVEILRCAVEKHGVEAHDPEDYPGLDDVYKKG
jgi:hypothetical protein